MIRVTYSLKMDHFVVGRSARMSAFLGDGQDRPLDLRTEVDRLQRPWDLI
jgi:hypothetical protein